MFVYEKKLQYPVKIANPNPKYAQIIISQYGGAYKKTDNQITFLSKKVCENYSHINIDKKTPLAERVIPNSQGLNLWRSILFNVRLFAIYAR